ncbi:unnamed protein product [Meloidogyne enterolobii]|uniref:Uncharacterized protein n=1 Tax=Meloidogyne enterolobii TaxID=390850 RepID=A0ACB0ZJR5_MELEN
MSKGGDESIASGPALSSLRPANVLEIQAREYLKEKEIEFGLPIMAERKGPVREGDVDLTTNIYPLIFQSNIRVCRYNVKVSGTKRSGRIVEFTKKFKDDFTKTERRFRTRDVLVTFMNKHKDMAKAAGCIYNDLQSIMYSLTPMSQQEHIKFDFSPSELHNASEFGRFKLDSITLEFTPTNPFQLSLEQIQGQRDLVYANRDLAQFLDIATSQDVFFREGEHVHFSTSNSYMYSPEMFGFKSDDTISFEDNLTYLGIGCDKAIHNVQGGKPGSAKKTPFHADDLLVNKVDAMLRSMQRASFDAKVAYLDKYLKGLMVCTTHNKNNVQYLLIKGFARESASQKEISINGQPTSVATYFNQKYGVSLSRMDLPLVISSTTDKDGKKQQNYYPIEVLQVCDNQRVKTNQLTSQMTQLAIRKCAVPPAILRAQMEKVAKSLHLWDSDYLNAARIQRANELNHPELQTGDGSVFPNKDTAGWRMNKVLSPQALVGKQYGWASFVFWTKNAGHGCLTQNEMDDFLRRYQQQASSRGIRLNDPVRKEIVTLNKLDDMAQFYDWASKNDIAFLLCFHGDSGDAEQVHHEVKANERRFFVITQCVRTGTVKNVIQKGQKLTIDNILNKTNVKLGGVNYTLSRSRIATDTSTLIIGFSANHPGGGIGTVDDTASDPNKAPSFVSGPPTAVGFAANVGPTKMPYDFIGDFLYQQAYREEKVNVIESIVQRCVAFFQSTRDGRLPQRVILFRNGCSEGLYPKILKYEVPLLRKALQVEGIQEPKLTLIVCNKLQSVRFFHKNINQNAKAPDQNLKPGTIIDTAAVHPEFAEFFLTSHRALQGTARTPKYTVVYDDCEHDLDELERITYDLCFGHQIVSSPISLPAPVLVASEYAKRGRNLYNSLFDELKQKNPDITYTNLNDDITFYGRTGTECWISEYRLNA